jgi:hypothetical protein
MSWITVSFSFLHEPLWSSALFPTAHMGDDLRSWTASYLAQDPDAQRQLKHFRLKCEKSSEYSIAKKDKKGKHVMKNTYIEEGFVGRILPIDGRVQPVMRWDTFWRLQVKYFESRSMENGCGSPNMRLVMAVPVEGLTTVSGESASLPYKKDCSWHPSTWFWNVKQIRAFAAIAYKVHHEKTSTLLNIYNHTYVPPSLAWVVWPS